MDGLFGFAEALGVQSRQIRWDMAISKTDAQFAAESCGHTRPVCVISPCSSQRFRNFRNWGIENYAALVTYLQQQYGAHVLLTGGSTPTELDYGERISAATKAPVTNLIGKTNLKQLLAILEAADLVICPDSGPAHMATAVGTPVVGLYATSNRLRTGPYFSQHLVVDKYPDAVRAEFHKPVNAVRWGQRVRNPDAMALITVDDVFDKVAMVLDAADDAPDDDVAKE